MTLTNNNVKQAKKVIVKYKSIKQKKRASAKMASGEPEQNQKMESVTKLNYVCYHKITWEKLRQKDIVQCLRYQRYGHIARNCAYQYRCVKCKGDHEPYKCEALKKDSEANENEKTEAFCVNCGECGHPANYKGCKVLQNLKNKVRLAKERKEKLTQERWTQRNFAIQSTNRIIRPGLTYAAAVSEAPGTQGIAGEPPALTTKTQVSQSSFDFITNECKSLFNFNLIDLIDKVNAFLPTYKNILDNTAKKSALINFTFQLCCN